MADAICLGELLIDFVPLETGESLQSVSTFRKLPGGAPANVAVGLKRLGVDCAFMGKVGDDAFGHFLAKTLAQEGIDVNHLHFSQEAHTTLAFIALAENGEREFEFYGSPGADMLFSPQEVDVNAIDSAKVVHFGSLSLRPAPVRDATLYALELAQEAGCLISYDPNLRLSLWSSEEAARAGLQLGLSKAQIVKMSEDEVAFLTGTGDFEKAVKMLWHDNLKLLVITQGSKGCRFFTPTAKGAVETFKVEAIDTTGAGDGFAAGLLQGIIKDPAILNDLQELRKLCRFANAVGAITTTAYGAIPALPDLVQVEQFLDRNT